MASLIFGANRAVLTKIREIERKRKDGNGEREYRETFIHVEQAILIYAASEFGFVNFPELPASLKKFNCAKCD